MNKEEQVQELKKQLERASCVEQSILVHKNGKVNVTFLDRDKSYTTHHPSLQSAIFYFEELGDYIKDGDQDAYWEASNEADESLVAHVNRRL